MDARRRRRRRQDMGAFRVTAMVAISGGSVGCNVHWRMRLKLDAREHDETLGAGVGPTWRGFGRCCAGPGEAPRARGPSAFGRCCLGRGSVSRSRPSARSGVVAWARQASRARASRARGSARSGVVAWDRGRRLALGPQRVRALLRGTGKRLALGLQRVRALLRGPRGGASRSRPPSAFGRCCVGPGERLAPGAISALWASFGAGGAPRARSSGEASTTPVVSCRWCHAGRVTQVVSGRVMQVVEWRSWHGGRSMGDRWVLVSWGRGFEGGWFRLVRGSRRGR